MSETPVLVKTTDTSFPRFSMLKTIGRSIASPIFFLLLFMVQMILNIYTYEFGHGISSELAGGWENNISVLGETFYTDPSYQHWLQSYLASQHITLQQYLANNLPPNFNEAALIQALLHQQLGFFWGIAGAFIFQALVPLLLFGYSRTNMYRRTVGGTGKLFLSSFLVISLADLSTRLLNVFSNGEGDDLWLLRIGSIGDNWLILGAIAFTGALLALLAYHVGRTQLTKSLAFLTQAPEAAARCAALGFTIGMLVVNFSLRLHLTAMLLPGRLYGIVFFFLFIGVAIYAGIALGRSANAVGTPVHIPGHLYVSYGVWLVCEIFFLLLNVGIITGANPGIIMGLK